MEQTKTKRHNRPRGKKFRPPNYVQKKAMKNFKTRFDSLTRDEIKMFVKDIQGGKVFEVEGLLRHMGLRLSAANKRMAVDNIAGAAKYIWPMASISKKC